MPPPSSSPGELLVAAPRSAGNEGHTSGAGERELRGGWRHALGMFCPCYARLVPADPIQPDLPTDGLPREPRAPHVACEQMLSRPVTFQGIASDELHGTSCQQLWLSCRLGLVHQAWLLLFFFLFPFFKSALTSELSSVAHLRCWR